MSATVLALPRFKRLVIGVDPGPVPGFVALYLGDKTVVDIEVLQCTANAASLVLRALLDVGPARYESRPLVQIERFVVGLRSARSANAGAGATTRDLVGQLQADVLDVDAQVLLRSAAAVKPWATDDRLAAVGLLEPTKGMRHARDAARHALFAAVRDGGLPDPLSKEYRR